MYITQAAALFYECAAIDLSDSSCVHDSAKESVNTQIVKDDIVLSQLIH